MIPDEIPKEVVLDIIDMVGSEQIFRQPRVELPEDGGMDVA